MITSSANKVIVAGNGAQTSFSFGFVGVAASDISAIYTDASGNETVLAQGPGSTQYQVSLNAAAQGALWGVGGTVTYSPGGTPIANGTTLTIVRTIANTQGVSLQNQSSFGQYAQAAETAMDLLEMQIQQVAEAQNRVVSAPIVDPSTINLTLPAAAQRAGLALGFDSSGNAIALSTLPAGTVSSAMQPVVNAASLALARTALGLGSMATLTPNLGLQENVTAAGNVDVNFSTAQDAANQAVTSAFHLTQRFATGALTYTLAKSSTLWNGFGFWFSALTGALTFTPNAADNFPGMSSGQSFSVPAGSTGFLTTNGAGTWWISGLQRIGFNSALNLQINASVASSALTVALKDSNGNDPSPQSPVLIAVRDPNQLGGDPIIIAVTSALSITAPNGATLASVANRPFKLWLGISSAGVLGLFQSTNWGSSPPNIGDSPLNVTPWDESATVSPAAISSGSNAAGTWYGASAGTNVTMRVLGYVEFGNGQPVAGTWSAEHTKTELMGAGIRKPGERFNPVYALNNTPTTINSTAKIQTLTTASITPTSKTNLVAARATGSIFVGNVQCAAILSRGAAPTVFGTLAVCGAAAPVTLEGLDSPSANTATAYYVFVWFTSAGTSGTWLGSSNTTPTESTITLEEVMT